MLRPSIFLGLVLLATLHSAAAYRKWVEGYPTPTNNQTVPTSPPFCPGVQTDDIVYKSFDAKPTSHRAGGNLKLTTSFKFNRWPEGATSIYCAIRNYNVTQGGATTGILSRDATFPHKKNKVDYDITQTESDTGRIEWVFGLDGKDKVVGKTWKLSAKIKLNKFVTLDAYTWRAYCETKQDVGVSWYYFKSWMEIDILPAKASSSKRIKGSK